MPPGRRRRVELRLRARPHGAHEGPGGRKIAAPASRSRPPILKDGAKGWCRKDDGRVSRTRGALPRLALDDCEHGALRIARGPRSARPSGCPSVPRCTEPPSSAWPVATVASVSATSKYTSQFGRHARHRGLDRAADAVAVVVEDRVVHSFEGLQLPSRSPLCRTQPLRRRRWCAARSTAVRVRFVRRSARRCGSSPDQNGDRRRRSRSHRDRHAAGVGDVHRRARCVFSPVRHAHASCCSSRPAGPDDIPRLPADEAGAYDRSAARASRRPREWCRLHPQRVRSADLR